MITTYGVYQENYDITFIMEDVTDDNGDIVSQEVVGFYYGEPDEAYDKVFKGRMKIVF